MEVKIFEWQFVSGSIGEQPDTLIAIRPTADSPQEQLILNLMGAYGDPAMQRQELILLWRWLSVDGTMPIYAALETKANNRRKEADKPTALDRVYAYLAAHWEQLPSGSILNQNFIDSGNQGIYQGKSWFTLFELPPMQQPLTKEAT